MDKYSYTFEMQLLLHPNFKNPDGALKRIVILCNLQAGASQQVIERHYTKVRRIVLDGVRKIMVAVDSTPNTPEVIAPPPAVVFSDDVMTLFADTADEILPQPLTTLTALHEQRIDDEFERWLTMPTTLRGASFSDFESVLTFWKRQQDMDTFRLLPLVARVVFSLPSSSAQIERDFGTASRMVVMPQRDSLAPHNVNMLTFLNSNRSYVNIAQCTKLSAGTASGRVSPNVMVNILQEQDDN
uniref:HAT C-terminal dimerisation domain-containing protein n=1 Tax=Phytophthora ramorum TaxID=164328 RepID=H3GX74_PHYRM